MRGKAWDGALQFTVATADLKEGDFLKAMRGGAGLQGAPHLTVPGKQTFQFSAVGNMGNGRAVKVQQSQEHPGGVSTEPVNLLTRLLGNATHDTLTAANRGHWCEASLGICGPLTVSSCGSHIRMCPRVFTAMTK